MGEPNSQPDLRGVGTLVTGGAGFIGSHLVDALLAAGSRVRVLDSFETASRENLRHCQAEIEVLEGDIRDPEACRRACSGVEIVFHQAALGSVPRSIEAPEKTVAVNVAGSANVFAAAREAGSSRVVYASSSSVYGDSDELPKSEGREGAPLSPYAASKQMTESLASVFAATYGQELVGLRYFNVFGPRQSPAGPYAAVLPRFFSACLEGRSPTIYGDGRQTRDFTAVADAVDANLLAAAAPASACGRAYNVAGGSSVSIVELLSEVQSLLGTELEATYLEPRAGDVAHSAADLTESAARLGYRPSHSLADGLSASRAFYAANLPTAET